MGGTAAPAASWAFTTRDIPPRLRRPALHSLADRGLLPIEPLAGRQPDVGVVKWRLPGASILWGSLSGVRQCGRPESRGAGDVFFGINVTGAGLARQGGRQVAIGGGDAVVADLAGGAFTVLRPDATRVIGVRVPRQAVRAGTAGGDSTLRVVPARTPALHLLTGYLRAVRGGPAPAAGLADAFVAHIADLITLSLSPAPADIRAAARPSIRAARLHAIKADIERHLTDPALSAAGVAGRHGITARYLHKLFEDEEQTYSRYVLHRRLELARRRLCDPGYADLTISAIAHRSGFGELSYFNRTFRRRFGRTPSEAREQVLADPRR